MDIKKLPIYSLVIDPKDDTGVDFVALVDKPAIEKNWMAFGKEEVSLKFVTASQERRIVTGALMIPDLPIYRKDTQLGEYYVFFTKETIWQIVQKYFKNGFTSNVNMMHDGGMVAKDVFMVESFQVDSSRGIKSPECLGNLPEGTWVGTFKVDNDEIWNEYIKTGVFNGFSVEGIFQHKYLVDKSEDQTKAIAQKILNLRAQIKNLKNLMHK